jgi:hypothetical protein
MNSDIRPKTKRSNEFRFGAPSPRSAADEQLLLQQQGFSHNGAYSVGAHELGDGAQQLDSEYKQVNHRHRRSQDVGSQDWPRRSVLWKFTNSPCTGCKFRD